MHRKSLAVAAAMATMIALPANAADIPIHIPLPAPPPPVEVFAGGWYLRGDISMTNQQSKVPRNRQLEAENPGDTIEWLQSEFDSGVALGAGVGYRFNSWLRTDVTGEYRGRTRYSGVERVRWATEPTGAWNQTNEFTADKTEAVALVNAYLDLGTWWGITPFVGAGIGVAHVTIGNFQDRATGNQPDGTLIAGHALYRNASRTNLAWALHAGAGYEVNDRLTLELAYRYLNMGRGVTGQGGRFTNMDRIANNWEFRDLHSHDLRFGMRWNLHGPSSAPVHRPLSRAF
ncbi:outer membrane protein [Salinarimonas sp.]|uniref:outer membrane protein n=1 Tax=Salinarimonas sp. TaxID=2766526 RepID=UPI00391DCDC7